MNLLASSLQCALLLNHIFILVSMVRCSMTPFSLEPGCMVDSFLDQAVDDSEHVLDSIFMDSIDTAELDASFNGADVMFLWSLHDFYTHYYFRYF